MLIFGSKIKPPEPEVKLTKLATENTEEIFVFVPVGEYLGYASRRGDIVTLSRFKGYLTSVDSDGRNLFMNACLTRKSGVLQWLFENFEKETGKPLIDALNQRDDYGCTTSHLAAAKGGIPATETEEATCMELLMTKGGIDLHINMEDVAGFTPLDLALQNFYPQIIKALIKRGDCDLNRFVNGQSPLQIIKNQLDEMIKALLTANPHLTEADEKTAKDALKRLLIEQIPMSDLLEEIPIDLRNIFKQMEPTVLLFKEVKEAILLRDVTPPSSSSAPAGKTPTERIIRLRNHLALLTTSADIDPQVLENLLSEILRLKTMLSAHEAPTGTGP